MHFKSVDNKRYWQSITISTKSTSQKCRFTSLRKYQIRLFWEAVLNATAGTYIIKWQNFIIICITKLYLVFHYHEPHIHDIFSFHRGVRCIYKKLTIEKETRAQNSTVWRIHWNIKVWHHLGSITIVKMISNLHFGF